MFKDRYDAAQKMLPYLQKYKHTKNVIILAIPRGALEIGSVIAQELSAPLDVLLVKKIGDPLDPELSIGAVTIDQLFLTPETEEHQLLKDIVLKKVPILREQLAKRQQKYRGDRAPLKLKDKVVIIVDDGIATGNSMMLAVDLVKQHNPKKIIVAVPVGPPDTIEKLKKKVDIVVCPSTPESFFGVGQFYQTFPQVEDDEAIALLKKANTS